MLDQGLLDESGTAGKWAKAHRPDVGRGDDRDGVEPGPKRAVGDINGRAGDDLPASSDWRGGGVRARGDLRPPSQTSKQQQAEDQGQPDPSETFHEIVPF